MGVLDEVIDLRVASKLFLHEANARTREMAMAEKEALGCLRKGDEEEAAIHAEEAVRCKSERAEFKRLAARLNATASQLETAARMHKVTRTMESTVRLMVSAGKKMDVAKVVRLMDRYDKESQNMRTKQKTVSSSMHQSTASFTPTSQVGSVLSKLADQAGLELSEQFSAHVVPNQVKNEGEKEHTEAEKPKRVAVPLGGGDAPPTKKKKEKEKEKKDEEEAVEESIQQSLPSTQPSSLALTQPTAPIRPPPSPTPRAISRPVSHQFLADMPVPEFEDDLVPPPAAAAIQIDNTTPVLEPEPMPRGPLIDFEGAVSVRATPVMPPPPFQPVACRPMPPIFEEASPPPPSAGLSLLDLDPPEVSLEDRLASLLGHEHTLR